MSEEQVLKHLTIHSSIWNGHFYAILRLKDMLRQLNTQIQTKIHVLVLFLSFQENTEI